MPVYLATLIPWKLMLPGMFIFMLLFLGARLREVLAAWGTPAFGGKLIYLIIATVFMSAFLSDFLFGFAAPLLSLWVAIMFAMSWSPYS